MLRSQKVKSTRKRSPKPRRRSSRKYRGGFLAKAKSTATKWSAKANEKRKETAAILQQKGKEAAKQAAEFAEKKGKEAAAIAKEKQINTCISFLESKSYTVIAP
jgi:hypothetical protein